MTEQDLSFDPSLKKKKKKKVGFGMDTVMGSEGKDDGAPASVPEQNSPENPIDEVNLNDDFSGMKKKKKKKGNFEMAELGESLSAAHDDDGGEQLVPGEDGGGTDDIDFNLPMRKKKKKPKGIAKTDLEDGVDIDGGSKSQEGSLFVDSDRDYTYDELLTRVFAIMREKNPEMVAGEKKKFVMKPPQVMRVGTKKTSFSNFAEICKLLHRQPKHVLAFLLAELGTSGSVDGNNQLILKGRFQGKHLESVLRKYIREYVTCHTCRSPDTSLQKDTRLYFLQCETCGSRCSVATIKSGFQALTGKRAAIRAKET